MPFFSQRSPWPFLLLLTPFVGCKDGPPPAVSAPTEASSAATPPTPDSASGQAPAAPGTVTLDDSGKSLTVPVGGPLTVKLKAAAGTGYTWDVTQIDSNILAQQGPPTREPVDPSQTGGPTHQVFSFVAKAAGTTHLEIALHRPWEKGAATRTFALDVTVK
jgi:predicted secreted protein